MRMQVVRALIGGALGVLALSIVLYGLAPWWIGQPIDVVGPFLAVLGLSSSIGVMLYLALGAVVFPVLYLVAFFPLLSGSPVRRGLTFGATLWFLVEAVVMPVTGSGFFHVGHGGIGAVLMSLVAHLAYGGLVGGLARRGPARDRIEGESPPAADALEGGGTETTASTHPAARSRPIRESVRS